MLTKKASRRVPSYRRHKPTGQAVVTLNGEDIYLGKWNTSNSRAEYDRLIGEWLAAGRQLPKRGGDLTIAELAIKYLHFAKDYYRKDGRPTGSVPMIKVTLRLLRECYGHTLANDFGPLALEALQNRLIGENKSRSTINETIAVIRRAFRWGVAKELVNPAVHQALLAVPGLRKGRTAAKEPKPVVPVENQVVDATLTHLTPILADMVMFQRLTGCRPGEVCLLRPMDIDRSEEVWRYCPVSHKTEHHDIERVIFIGPKAQDVLRPYLLRPADTYCFSPVESEQQRLEARHATRKTPLSYGNSPGTARQSQPKRRPNSHFTKDSYNRAIQRGCEAAFGMPNELRRIPKMSPKDEHGVRHEIPAEERKRLQKLAAEWRAKHCWSPNQLRHAAGTEVRRLFGLEAAQVVLGHAKADVTQVYADGPPPFFVPRVMRVLVGLELRGFGCAAAGGA